MLEKRAFKALKDDRGRDSDDPELLPVCDPNRPTDRLRVCAHTDGWRTAPGERTPNLVWSESRDALSSIQTTHVSQQEALRPNQL